MLSLKKAIKQEDNLRQIMHIAFHLVSNPKAVKKAFIKTVAIRKRLEDATEYRSSEQF